MPFSNGIVHSSLAVLVLAVQILAAQRDEVGDQGSISLSRGIEDWILLQSVLFMRVDTHLDQDFHHLECQFLITDDAGCERKRLGEVLQLVDYLAKVNVGLTSDTDDLIDITSFDFFKDNLLKRRVLGQNAKLSVRYIILS